MKDLKDYFWIRTSERSYVYKNSAGCFLFDSGWSRIVEQRRFSVNI